MHAAGAARLCSLNASYKLARCIAAMAAAPIRWHAVRVAARWGGRRCNGSHAGVLCDVQERAAICHCAGAAAAGGRAQRSSAQLSAAPPVRSAQRFSSALTLALPPRPLQVERMHVVVEPTMYELCIEAGLSSQYVYTYSPNEQSR